MRCPWEPDHTKHNYGHRVKPWVLAHFAAAVGKIWDAQLPTEASQRCWKYCQNISEPEWQLFESDHVIMETAEYEGNLYIRIGMTYEIIKYYISYMFRTCFMHKDAYFCYYCLLINSFIYTSIVREYYYYLISNLYRKSIIYITDSIILSIYQYWVEFVLASTTIELSLNILSEEVNYRANIWWLLKNSKISTNQLSSLSPE